MKKQILIVIILIVLLVGSGIGECLIVRSAFSEFSNRLETLWEQAGKKAVDYSSFEDCLSYWKKMRERLEFFLNHLDITEIDLRLAECKAYLINNDYTNAMAQLSILIEMADHVPHMALPSIEHIV